jgi:hypothetical protein
VCSVPEADIKRFMAFVDKLPNGCWFWMGARSRGKGNKKWYGSFKYKGRSIRAHRFSHDELGGKVCPPGFHRDHLCKFSLCVNFDHIEAVPHEVNQHRKVNGHSNEVSSGSGVAVSEQALCGVLSYQGPFTADSNGRLEDGAIE